MFAQFFYYLKRADWILYVVTILLVFFGLAVLYSISVNQEVPDLSRFYRQVIFAVSGIALMFLFTSFDYRFFNSYRIILFAIGIVLLLAVLFFGQTIRGSTRWFGFFGQTFQPVEIVKLFVVFFLSGYLAKHSRQFFLFRHILVSGAFVFATAILIALEPKVGYAIILILLWFIMLLIVKVRPLHLIVIILTLAVLASLAWVFVLEDYQKDRVMTFIDPSRDPLKSGYNVTQSIIAVGSGQVLGRGLGLGPQSQLNFLPEQETDFIFAVIAEEMGLVGVIIIISFFSVLIYRIWLVASKVRDNFALFFTLATLVLLAIQIFINIGMNVGLMPVTGIPLPFLSAGGSSLLVSLVTIGIVQSALVRSRA
ncbi:rod shape-determining protein RodA [Patescibacteria group bacterium]|nr:rod shape-determining protein RodA [Patescibacteria group bacterium]